MGEVGREPNCSVANTVTVFFWQIYCSFSPVMRYKSKSKKRSAANARNAKAQKRLRTADKEDETASTHTDSDSDVEVTSWTGGVKNHLIVSDDSDSDHFDNTEWEMECSEDEIDELEGEELIESLRKEIEHEISLLKELDPTPYEKISQVNLTTKEWKKAEKKRGFGYNGRAEKTQRTHRQQA